MDNKYISYYKSISLIMMALWVPCWLYDDLMIWIGLGSNIGRFLGIFNIIAITFLFNFQIRISNTQKILILLYSILIVYLVILLYKYWGTEYSTLGEVSRVVLGILFLLVLNNSKFNFKRLVKFFINIGFVFALLSLIAFLDRFLEINLIPYSSSNHPPAVTSITGYTSSVYIIGNIMRVQSFWSEPARFAQFLIFPLMLVYTRYLLHKRKKDILIVSVIIVSLFLTYSIAVISSLLIILMYYFIIRKSKSTSFGGTFFKRSIFLLIGLGLAISIYNFYQFTDNASSIDSFYGKKTSEAVIDRFDRFSYANSVTSETIFGDRSVAKLFNKNPSVYGNALIYGGIPYIIICLIFTIIFYFSIIKKIRNSKYKFIYLGSLAYYIAFSWYGMFTENFYLFQIALLTTIINYENQNKEIFLLIKRNH
jgi:hypothetical protein